MCGIVGFWGYGAEPAVARQIGRGMTQSLKHRGPDATDLWIDDERALVFGHRRLSIQDLSAAGSQPMLSHDGRYVITYNGEIYNFLELAGQLTSQGVELHGHSDTEVLVEAISRWGFEQALESAVGMYAFALWDRSEGKLRLARDRLGEKPLYYGWLGSCFVFASELKALLRHPAWPGQLSRPAMNAFLRYGYVPDPLSIYQGVYKLPPASVLTVLESRRPSDFSPNPDVSKAGPRCYWRASDSVSVVIDNEETAIRSLDTALKNAVRRQIVADVPVGAFLSGGVDSTTVAAVMQSESERPIRTFTIGFDERRFDEAPHAKAIAKHLGTDHSELYVSGQAALDVIPNLPSMFDEPFADPSALPSYLVAKMARNEVTVCLSGDGGDELFAGYNRYIDGARLWSRLRPFPPNVRATLAGLIGAVPGPFWRTFGGFSTGQSELVDKVQKLSRAMQQPTWESMYAELLAYCPDPDLLQIETEAWVDPYLQTPDWPVSNLQRTLGMDQSLYLPGDNLTKVDRTSMAVSLEVRLPLLSHEIVELSWRLVDDLKIRRSIGKWILRQVLSRYVPRELYERPKMGFSVPISDWLRGPLRDWAGDLLSVNRLQRQGIFDPKSIQQIWNNHQSGRKNEHMKIWALAVFQSWAESVDYT